MSDLYTGVSTSTLEFYPEKAMACSNCNNSAITDTAITLRHGNKVIATICDTCQKRVLITKVVIERERTGDPESAWTYAGYSPVASAKSA